MENRTMVQHNGNTYNSDNSRTRMRGSSECISVYVSGWDGRRHGQSYLREMEFAIDVEGCTESWRGGVSPECQGRHIPSEGSVSGGVLWQYPCPAKLAEWSLVLPTQHYSATELNWEISLSTSKYQAHLPSQSTRYQVIILLSCFVLLSSQ